MEKSHHEYATHASMEKDVTKMMMNMQGFLYWEKNMERSRQIESTFKGIF